MVVVDNKILLWSLYVLCCFAASVIAVHVNSYRNSLQERDIKGMLYFNQIPSLLVALLKDEIKAFNLESALQWQDTSGLSRTTFEFGISFKAIDENGRIVKYEMPSFLVETQKAGRHQ